MPHTTRTFIALPIPASLKAKLERLQRLIAPSLPDARWVEPAGFHITLAFLGDVDDLHLSSVCNAVAESVRGFSPIDLTIRSLGAFPDMSRPRVFWVGIEGDLEELAALQAAVFAGAETAGYRPDAEKFRPHITLGRMKVKRGQEVDVTPLEAHYRTWAAGVFTADSVVTYASTGAADGPSYTPLGIASLSDSRRP
jgi:2'-5' RNA ligase